MAFDNRSSVAILRIPGGLDFSSITEEEPGGTAIAESNLTHNSSRSDIHTVDSSHMMHADSNLNLSSIGVPESVVTSTLPVISKSTTPSLFTPKKK